MPELIQPHQIEIIISPEPCYEGFKSLVEGMGIAGTHTQRERQLGVSKMSAEEIAIMLTAINSFSRGKKESDIADKTMNIGETQTIAPEERGNIFLEFVEDLKSRAETISPERFGDAIALATVLLHPFEDGNGRTARLIGSLFRKDFIDSKSYDILSESRDTARERGGFLINGYIPFIEEYGNRSDPNTVIQFLKDVLNEEKDLYTGPYGQAELVFKQP